MHRIRCGRSVIALSTLAAFAGWGLIVPVLSPASAQTAPATTWIAPGAPAPHFGTGVVYETTSTSTWNRFGRISTVARLVGPGVTPGIDETVMLTGSRFGARTVLRRGDAAPVGTPGVFFQSSALIPPPILLPIADDLNRLTFTATLSGGLVTENNDFSIWNLDAATNAVSLREREGANLPGLPAGVELSNILIPRQVNGHSAYIALLRGTGVDASNDVCLYARDPMGVARLIAREGAPAEAIPNATIRSLNLFGIYDNGLVLYIANLNGTGVTNDAALYLGDGSFSTRVARVGDQALGFAAGTLYRTISTASTDSSGFVVFRAGLQGPGSPADDEALILRRGSSNTILYRTGQPAPGFGAGINFGTSASPFTVEAGQVAFTCNIRGTGVSSTNDGVLFRHSFGITQPIARENDPAPRLSNPNIRLGVATFVLTDFDGGILADYTLTGAGVTTSNNSALYYISPTNEFFLLARKGDPVEITPGNPQNISSYFLQGGNSGSGRGLNMLRGGRTIFTVAVGDGSIGAIRTTDLRIPPPINHAWTIPTPMEFNTNQGVNGTSFEPQFDIEVTALGYFDDILSTPEGLAVPHPVGIYSVNTASLVAQAVIPAGTAAPRENAFRFVDIPPVKLTAGDEYVIVGVSDGDPGHNVAASSMNVGPWIVRGNWRIGGAGPNLSYPNVALNTTARFMGPSFKYRVTTACRADLDDGTGDGVIDEAVDVNDLLFFLTQFEAGSRAADLDDGSNTGNPDGAVDINDLLYFITRFEAGC